VSEAVNTSIRKWKALIVDDEELARKIVREMLSTHPEIELVAECANGMEAVKAAAEFAPDLMFLDVQMPKLTGFDVLELVDASKLAVIFVTAYDQYAMKAFDVHALDYLLKPFSRDRFESALARAKSQKTVARTQPALLAAAARPAGQCLERIVVKDGTKVTLIPVAKLDYAEALDDYVSLVSEGKKHLKQQTISGLEMALGPALFVRIHRSYLVNLERVVRIEPYAKDSKVAILTSGVKLPVSRAGFARLKKLLDDRT
jgi:two-component system LytT family response regulator